RVRGYPRADETRARAALRQLAATAGRRERRLRVVQALHPAAQTERLAGNLPRRHAGQSGRTQAACASPGRRLRQPGELATEATELREKKTKRQQEIGRRNLKS